MTSEDIWLIVSLVVLILLSAFFSASETAYSSLNSIRIKNMAQDGNKKAARVLRLTEKYDYLLTTILIGNNIVNLASASIATILFVNLCDGDQNQGALISTIVMTVLVLIFGEISPKSIAREMPEDFAMKVTPVLKILIIIFYPLCLFFSKLKAMISHRFNLKRDDSISEGEFLTMVKEATQEGGIDKSDSDMIYSVIEFNDLTAEDILVPRVDVVAIQKDTTKREITTLFNKYEYSRLPVYDESIDDIIGFIHQKDYVSYVMPNKKKLEEIIKPILFVIPSMKIVEALKLLQKKHVHIAVVADEFGGTLGIITMEDILEELVGEIWDEHDQEIKEFEKISDNEFKIKCSSYVDTFLDYFELDDKTDQITVSGWVMEKLGKIPEVGDSFVCENLEITVIKTESRRPIEILVRICSIKQPKNLENKENTDK